MKAMRSSNITKVIKPQCTEHASEVTPLKNKTSHNFAYNTVGDYFEEHREIIIRIL